MSADRLPDNLDELLLDDHMGLLEPDEQAHLDRLLSSHPEIRARRERLAKALQPLEAYSVPAAPANLVRSVMDHIEFSQSTLKFEPNRLAKEQEAQDASLLPSLMPLREVLAVAAAILIIVGVFVPSYYGVRDRSDRAMQSGLGAIGQGESSYVVNEDRPIFSSGQPNASWLPVSTQPSDQMSHGHPFLRLEMRYVLPGGNGVPGQMLQQPVDLDETSWPSRMLINSPGSAIPSLRLRIQRAPTTTTSALDLVDPVPSAPDTTIP